MPIGLIGLALCSCIHLHIIEKQPRIQLKDDDQHEGNGLQNGDSVSVKEEGESEEDDEGVPVELDQWWLKVRIRKAALVAVLALLDAAACINLGWTASHGSSSDSDTYTIVEDGCMVAFWVSGGLTGQACQIALTPTFPLARLCWSLWQCWGLQNRTFTDIGSTLSISRSSLSYVWSDRNVHAAC